MTQQLILFSQHSSPVSFWISFCIINTSIVTRENFNRQTYTFSILPCRPSSYYHHHYLGCYFFLSTGNVCGSWQIWLWMISLIGQQSSHLSSPPIGNSWRNNTNCPAACTTTSQEERTERGFHKAQKGVKCWSLSSTFLPSSLTPEHSQSVFW